MRYDCVVSIANYMDSLKLISQFIYAIGNFCVKGVIPREFASSAAKPRCTNYERDDGPLKMKSSLSFNHIHIFLLLFFYCFFAGIGGQFPVFSHLVL